MEKIRSRLFAAWLLLMFTFTLSYQAASQTHTDVDWSDAEDITVFLLIQNVGGYEIDVVYANDNIYIPVGVLFQLLKINHESSSNNDSISGFFLKEENRYYISANTHTLVVGNASIALNRGELFKNEFGLYLKNTVFEKAFGLNIKFNFRSLSLELTTSHDLPVIKELRQEQMRKNINRLSGVVMVDTVLDRRYHLARGGMVDWSVISTQTSGNATDTRAVVAGGMELFGGEATAILNISSKNGVDERQQQYRWRYVNNDAKYVKQVSAGKIQMRSISSLYAPVIGASVTNTPTTFRKSFGSFVLSDYTEPGWTVELYINNVIVNFTTADATGFFSFEVPLVYGATDLVLKFYGPWGEERIREQTINIPFNFIPTGTMEYNASTGMVMDSTKGAFSRAEVLYGVSRSITMGAGVEYLSSIKANRPEIPFINMAARFLNNFMFTGEYSHGVRAKGLLNYRVPMGLSFDIDYTKYVEGQTAIIFNYLEERKATISFPMSIGPVRTFGRASFRQNVLPQTIYSNAEVVLSSNIKGVSANISAYANWLPEGNPFMYSNLGLGFKVAKTYNIRPQAQFDITNGQFISFRTNIEKTFKQRAFLSLGYEENVRTNTRSVEVGFRYDLPFAQTAATTRVSNNQVSTTQSARGTFAFNSGNAYVHIDNRSNVGRGGITVMPYLDINNNDTMDINEPMASGLNVRINGGKLMNHMKDSIIRIMELEPFASFLLEVEDVSFENIAWQLDKKTYSVKVDPNQFKMVGIPVKVKGEINGMVAVKRGKSLSGQGRILLNIKDSKDNTIKRIMSEADGYYNYLGLAPGAYTIAPDSGQMARLSYVAEPEMQEFEIAAMEMGDIVDEVNFTLISTKPEPEPEAKPAVTPEPEAPVIHLEEPEQKVYPEQKPVEKPVEKPSVKTKEKSEKSQAEPKGTVLNGLKLLDGTYNVKAGLFYVQLGAWNNYKSAKKYYNKISERVDVKLGLLKDGSYYKLRVGTFATEGEAEEVRRILHIYDIRNFISSDPE